MLETSRERVKLLKAGMSSRKIEQLYIESNNFKIVDISLLFEAVEVRYEDKKKVYSCEVPAEFVIA